MAYYNFFPQNQNPYFQQQPQMQPQIQQQITQQTVNGGYITVRSEEEARNYPVAPGASVTFFNETQPFCYKKTMGNSPLDRPDFKVYEIIEKTTSSETPFLKPTSNETSPSNVYTLEQLKCEIDRIYKEIDALKTEMNEMQLKKSNLKQKNREVEENEPIDKQSKNT